MIIEETTVIEVPMDIVMQMMGDVRSIPAWATVKGTISNVQGVGSAMQYDWQFTIDELHFTGHSKVIEQTTDILITETTGDITSLWTINLTPLGKQTMLRVVVEYLPPNPFVEVLADKVIQQLATPAVAQENIKRFKELVEERAQILAR